VNFEGIAIDDAGVPDDIGAVGEASYCEKRQGGSAPMWKHRCGANAANYLDAFIAKRPVTCTPISLDQYGRTVASCSIEGHDLAEWLVRNGLALDSPKYSKGKYEDSQRDAEHARRGIWEGTYVVP
jgi:endonuclease YncB( thermonuclease family)